MDINEIMKEAQTAANQAATEKFQELTNHGPKYAVHEADLGGKITSGQIGTLLDDCGGAYITLGGREQFVREAKKQGVQDENCHPPHYNGDGWSMWKGVYSGYIIHLDFDLQGRQEVSIHAAAMEAAVEVMKQYGMNANVKTYID